MSLYGMMRTGVSGMNAQANRLSTVADNIANAGTTGYKRSSTEFSSLIIPNVTGNYTSGGVTTSVRYAISQQGDLKYTTSTTDLAINGDGFFVVQDPSGKPFLTRAGSFVPDGDGRLVNAAGFYLMGYSCAERHAERRHQRLRRSRAGADLADRADGGAVARTACSPPTCRPARPSSPPANLPSANAATATASAKSSLVVYDNLGNEVLLDVYFTKTGTNTWEVAVYNQANAAPGTSFPYTAGPLAPPTTLTFDATTGKLTAASAERHHHPGSGRRALHARPGQASASSATGYTVLDSKVDGNAPSGIDKIEIGEDGTIYAQYENGSFKALYRIPIATVQSPDQLNVDARQRLFAEQRFRRHPDRLCQ